MLAQLETATWIYIISGILIPLVGWALTKLYSLHTGYVKAQFKSLTSSNSEQNIKLDDITMGLKDLDRDKVGWEQFRDVKKGMEDDRETKIRLAVSEHVEKRHMRDD